MMAPGLRFEDFRFEVHIDLNGRTHQVGLARSSRARGAETVLFEYSTAWLDDSSMETWEEIALRLAKRAGIATPKHELMQVDNKAVLLSRRFDRAGTVRIPFLSAMAMLAANDGEPHSYPEIVDALTQHGAQARIDAHALYRRVAFNVLISNVDDHLRNHGFLWLGRRGWSLAPAYDLNPTPTDLKGFGAVLIARSFAMPGSNAQYANRSSSSFKWMPHSPLGRDSGDGESLFTCCLTGGRRNRP